MERSIANGKGMHGQWNARIKKKGNFRYYAKTGTVDEGTKAIPARFFVLLLRASRQMPGCVILSTAFSFQPKML